MTTTTDVRFWDVRRKRYRNVVAYEVRWVVAGKQRSRSRRTKELAESFLADLRQAARRGEAFDADDRPARIRDPDHRARRGWSSPSATST